MNKRIVSGLVATALVFSGTGIMPDCAFEGFSLTASAVEIVDSGYCGNPDVNEGKDVTWKLDSEGTLTISGTGAMDYSFNVPWGNLRSQIKKVIINDGVTSITYSAFSGCTNLSNIDIPNSVTDIRNGAFDNTPWLEAQRAKNPLVIVNNILIDGKKASGDVIVPDGVERVDISAFMYNDNVTSIYIPESVIDINKSAWALGHKEYPNLQAINVSEKNTHYTSIEGIVYLKDFRTLITLIFCPQTKTTVSVPNGVIYIKEAAFNQCWELTDIVLPDTLEYINFDAFNNCKNLKNVTIPAGVNTIREKALGYLDDKKYDGFTITGYKNTAAETYANENGFEFISLGEAPATVTPGDLDGSGGEPDVDDLVLMQKAVAGWRIDENYKKAADIDKDGDVDVDDLVLMQKIVAGWRV